MSSSSHHDSKSQKAARALLAFVLFLAVSALSLSACLRFVIISPTRIVDTFCNSEYVSALCDDVLTYAKDECDSAALPYETVEDSIDYKTVFEIQEAYISGALAVSEDFTDTSYLDDLEDLEAKLEKNVESVIEKYDLKTDSEVENGKKIFSSNICNYIKERVSFKYMDKLSTLLAAAKGVSLAIMVISAVITALLIPVIQSIGHKKYRNWRYVAYAFLSAAMLNLLSVIGVEVIRAAKDLVLYPLYLTDTIMRYVTICELGVLSSSVVLVAIALMLSVIIWKMKRNDS